MVVSQVSASLTRQIKERAWLDVQDRDKDMDKDRSRSMDWECVASLWSMIERWSVPTGREEDERQKEDTCYFEQNEV